MCENSDCAFYHTDSECGDTHTTAEPTMTYEVQVSTALPRPRYFVVDPGMNGSGARVVGTVFGHTTEEAANAELDRLTNRNS